MKKIFIQVKEWILKHRKSFIYGIFALFIVQVCFFSLGQYGIGNEVLAADDLGQTQNDVAQNKAAEWSSTFSFLNKIIYVLIYPMLLLAGKLVDNSLVYGEAFGFDAVLWQLWNIVKNLANFTLGFIFIYKIFKYLIGGQKGDDIKKLLIGLLIAGIGIQASWFAMAALVDISTILTYGVGGLPISILKENGKDITNKENWEYNPAVLKSVVYVDAKDIDTVHIYLTSTKAGEDIFISECETFRYGGSETGEELIFAPKMIYYNDSGTEILTDSNRCHYYGQVYYFSSLYSGDQFINGNKFNCGNGDCSAKQDEYKAGLVNIRDSLKRTTDIKGLIEQGQILQIRNAHTTGWTDGTLWTGVYEDQDMRGLDVDNKRTGSGGTTSRLQDIMDGNSYVGVFTALYTSLINQGKGIISEEGGLFATVLNRALSFGYIVAIGIPLIVVSIVFMIRICVLWMAIVLSPFIALASAFKEIGDKIFKGKFLEYFNIKNLIPIIFSPAIICFAVSMSTVLVMIISKFNATPIASNKETILGGLIELKVGGLSIPLAKLVISVFCVAITWFIIWAAIEATKIGESKIITSLKGLATSALGSMKVVPIPGKDGKGVSFIGADAAFGLNGQQGILSKISDNIKTKTRSENEEALNQRLDPEKAKADAKKAQEAAKNAQDEQVGKDFVTAIQQQNITSDWTQMPVRVTINGKVEDKKFIDLSDISKKAVINGINEIQDKNQRQKFNTNVEIQIGNDKYKFKNSTNKYEIEQAPQTSQSGQ